MRQEQWCRELWLRAVDLPTGSSAHEVDDNKSAIGAARGEQVIALADNDNPQRRQRGVRAQGR